MNIANVLTASAERDPGKAAIVLKNESISYEQLDRATTSLARWFLRQGQHASAEKRDDLDSTLQ